MAQPHILEGTWEKIKLHDEELTGRFLHIVVDPDKQPFHGDNGNAITDSESDLERVSRIKSLRGKYSHLGVTIEDLHHERAAERAPIQRFPYRLCHSYLVADEPYR